MSDPDPETWKDHYSARERVRLVVETLTEPATIKDIADEAAVAWATADSELEALLAENNVKKYTQDGTTRYDTNPVKLFLDEILDLINENSREELENSLVNATQQLEELQAEFNVDTHDELRGLLVEEDLTAGEMRNVQNAASTWSALETDSRLIKHALQLYDDVTTLSEGDDHIAVA
ncbi:MULTISPECIES: ArsR family transcriptional regulator [unclassified Haladaptatus]|uniref:DUF7342 family protein n=1 Tax=unclassified Haladaptatus TaxID=2622732 RepID=UPI0023E8A3B7|nr:MULTISPECIES: ArsR family transcriptional regulator [unclassified Haladaptatus]